MLAEDVNSGALIVLPTDTVYGIGADPYSREAVSRLLAAKGREETMPPPVLAADAEAAFAFAAWDRMPKRAQLAARRLAHEFWPGPLTLIVPTTANLGWDLSLHGGTVAVRVPNEEATLALLRQTGPLAVTSANLSGQAAALTVDEARGYFGEAVTHYVDGGKAKLGQASTIVSLADWPAQQLRAGALDWGTVSQVLEGID